MTFYITKETRSAPRGAQSRSSIAPGRGHRSLRRPEGPRKRLHCAAPIPTNLAGPPRGGGLRRGPGCRYRPSGPRHWPDPSMVAGQSRLQARHGQIVGGRDAMGQEEFVRIAVATAYPAVSAERTPRRRGTPPGFSIPYPRPGSAGLGQPPAGQAGRHPRPCGRTCGRRAGGSARGLCVRARATPRASARLRPFGQAVGVAYRPCEGWPGRRPRGTRGGGRVSYRAGNRQRCAAGRP